MNLLVFCRFIKLAPLDGTRRALETVSAVHERRGEKVREREREDWLREGKKGEGEHSRPYLPRERR